MTNHKPSGDGRPSIHNVAAYAGVSIATVSKVMQGVATVRPENVVAVQNAIEALGYRINPLASELRRGRRTLVGAIVPRFDEPGASLLLSRLEEEVEARGYTLLAASSRGSEARECELVTRMQDWRVSGLVVLPCRSDHVPAVLLLKDGPPSVFVGYVPDQSNLDAVLMAQQAFDDTRLKGVNGRGGRTRLDARSSEAALAATAVSLLFERIELPDRRNE